MRLFIAFFSFFFLHVVVVDAIAVSREKPHSFDELNLVWTASYGEEGEQVYTSSIRKKKWSIPVQVSDAAEHVFHSAATVAGDGSHWVVWAQSEKKKKLLYFSTDKRGQWSKPRQIVTGMDDNRNVTIVIDSKGQPFIAWTGVDKTYSDIFWSRIIDDSWSTARKVHGRNNVPDVDPVLMINTNGDIVLSWRTFNDGRSVTAFLQWNGKSWVEGDKSSRESLSAVQQQRRKSLPQPPEYIHDLYKAAFFYKDKYGTGTIPLI